MELFGGPGKKKRIAALEGRADQVATQLGSLSEQLHHLRIAVEQANQPQPMQTAAEAAGDKEAHTKLLRRAAGVACARLSCHRDTWDFIVAKAADTEHFRLPRITAEGESCLIGVDVSGRALIAILEALRKTANPSAGGSEGTHSLASQAYRRIAKSLRQVSPAKSRQPGEKAEAPMQIVIDDRPATAA